MLSTWIFLFSYLFINHFQDFEADESYQMKDFEDSVGVCTNKWCWNSWESVGLRTHFRKEAVSWGDKEILLLFSEAFKTLLKNPSLGSDIRKNGLVESEFFWSWYHRLATGSSEIWVNSIFFGQVANVLRHVYLYLNSQLPKSGFNML